MAQFNETLELEPERAYYGVRHVEKANAANAIQTLLVSDALFRSKDIKERKRYRARQDSLIEVGSDQRFLPVEVMTSEKLGVEASQVQIDADLGPETAADCLFSFMTSEKLGVEASQVQINADLGPETATDCVFFCQNIGNH